ncbi:MAG: proline dehydrogenase family protein [Pirellulales bacterium]
MTTAAWADPAVIDLAVALARRLLEQSLRLQTSAERRQQAELDRMLQTPADKNTIVQLTDQAFRSQRAERTAEHLTHILDVQGIPRFFSRLDRALLRGFQTFGGWLPGVSVPLVKSHLQHETANVVLPAETELLVEHLRARRDEGVRMNLNFLGEAMLGEAEARRRLEKYLAALQLPEVEVVSVKISTLYSQIAPHARTHTLRRICERLELLYREAQHLEYVRRDGVRTPKFIYLDMEEYRDLELTAEAFMTTLDQPALARHSAGIALQAYIPDSAAMQQRICEWARRRVDRGGAPVTIRLVKGANLEAERVEASQRGWPQAPFLTKVETDANYKRLLFEAFRPENLAAVRVGIASHNLFDVALGLVLSELAGPAAEGRVQFEMLEGMANAQRRALFAHATSLLLYAPACRREEFLNAVGYLLRRLDENTGPENFLRHAFRLAPDSDDWKLLEQGFRAAFTHPVSNAPRRTQNRLTERFDAPQRERPWREFVNEPDTDFSLPANARWAEQIVAHPDRGWTPSFLPLVVGNPDLGWLPSDDSADQSAADQAAYAQTLRQEALASGRRLRSCLDPSRPGAVLAQYVEADDRDVETAVAVAKADPNGWRSHSVDQRSEVLGQVAVELRRARGTLMRAALANGGKTLLESDPEVSEAVDFVEFYRATAREFYELPGQHVEGRGVVAVVPPWNFPIAIPCGGIAAALAAGNTVIVKPASDAVLVAWELCRCFWRAGVPTSALQFVPCPGAGAGSKLVSHPDVDAVILTGGTATALQMLQRKPTLRLFAETGGKNATIVTAMSDRELAIKHVIQSAFGHGGQKCSATSLLLLEAEVYDDLEFRQTLVDAVESLQIGSAWELASRVGPLIRPPSGELETALKTLEPGEEWAVLPRQIGDNPHLWSPGVKYGVTPLSVTHLTEFFGPLLGVMRFTSLDEAIDIVNATGYGLTSGLHSLDDREQARWKERILAGNLYLNRSTTGAIVLRQPFGGQGRSVVGAGLKAGGPHYVAQLLRFRETDVVAHDDSVTRDQGTPEETAVVDERLAVLLDDLCRAAPPGVTPHDLQRLTAAVASYSAAWRDEFSRTHDHFRLVGQDNVRRYSPFRSIRIRVAAEDTAFDILARLAAARTVGARIVVSSADDDRPLLAWLELHTETWAGDIEFWTESDAELAADWEASPPHAVQRIRFAHPSRVPLCLRQAAARTGGYLADEPVLGAGRVELLWYVREQSVCFDYHRYGNLGARAGEERAAVT